MTTETFVLSAEFPRAVRGYAPTAVDDFVRQLGERLDALQTQLSEQTARADRLAKELSAAKNDLSAARNDLSAFTEKEAAIANALVAVEQRRAGVERELEARNAETTARAKQTLEETRREAEAIISEARRQAEEITASAEAASAAQVERLRALCAEYDQTVARIRRALEDQLALLPAPGATLNSLSIPDPIAVTTTLELTREQVADAA